MKNLVGKLVEVVFYEDSETIPVAEHGLIGTVTSSISGWICIKPSEEITLHDYPRFLYMEKTWINLRFVKAVRLILVGELAREPELE